MKKTLVERFKEAENGNKLSVQVVAEFINLENIMSIAKSNPGEICPSGEECLQFAMYLYDRYGTDFLKNVNVYWPNEARIFKIAKEYYSKSNIESIKKETEAREKLMEYLFSKNVDRYIEICTQDSIFPDVYLLQKTIFPSQEKMAKRWAYDKLEEIEEKQLKFCIYRIINASLYTMSAFQYDEGKIKQTKIQDVKYPLLYTLPKEITGEMQYEEIL